MDKLDQEQIEEYKEAFKLFDKGGKGFLPAKDVAAFMRHMGTILTDAETLEMIREAGGSDTLSEGQLLGWMGNKMTDNYTQEDLIKAFQVFDKDGQGLISVAELRFVLCCLGDRLDDEAVDVMLNQADPSGCGSVQYEGFVNSMLRQGR